MRHFTLLIILALTFSISCASKNSKKAEAGAEKDTATKSTTKTSATKKVTQASSPDSMSTSCKLDNFTRDLTINKPADGGCEVIYTKDGETQTIANGSKVSDYCNEVFNRVKGKLESSGFKCE